MFGIRVDKKAEIDGLDMPEMGIKGYEDIAGHAME